MEQNSERIKKLQRATLANIGLVAFSGLMFGITKNAAFLAEQVHDSADSVAHGSRLLAEVRGIDQESNTYRNVRRFTMLVLSLVSGFTAARFGVNILNGLEENTTNSQQLFEFGGSIVVAGGNMYAYRQMDMIESHSHASHDSRHHARTDMIASLGLSACIASDAAGINGAAEWGGLIFSTYTAIELFPSNDRLESH